MMIRLLLRAFLVFVLMCSQVGTSSAGTASWKSVEPTAAGWSVEKLKTAQKYSETLRPTAVIVVQNGKIIASWGNVSRKVNVASVRKSLLSALYGIVVSEGRIDLSSTIAELGIDDKRPSLTDTEKRATVRDLLMSRSGIYHPAAYETADIKRKRPARGSHTSGSFWFYNNWDFNVLGTIYRQQTGEDIFRSFEQKIALPIQMEDFSARDGQYVAEPESDHPAYPFHLSARDAARFGQLFLNGGRWESKQIVPASWVKDATTAYSWTKRGRQGYGFMWWVLPPEVWGAGAAYASGYGGQIIAFIPSKQLVVVQTVDLRQNPKGVRTSHFMELLQMIAAAAPSTDN